mmetsp:Transcript_1719/g.2470  ORF Transcript_1719/g.2470 Transcript_1719/m.2470 type:complete len:97 (-) Transcript_1719:157-447(-)
MRLFLDSKVKHNNPRKSHYSAKTNHNNYHQVNSLGTNFQAQFEPNISMNMPLDSMVKTTFTRRQNNRKIVTNALKRDRLSKHVRPTNPIQQPRKQN